MGQRRKFSAEDKREAVAMLDGRGVSVSQIAAELGIGTNAAHQDDVGGIPRIWERAALRRRAVWAPPGGAPDAPGGVARRAAVALAHQAVGGTLPRLTSSGAGLHGHRAQYQMGSPISRMWTAEHWLHLGCWICIPG